MATKKTKTLTEVIEKLPVKRKAKIEKRTDELINVLSDGWPKMNQGSHLTVKTFEDGRTELIWDDEALLRDVRDAILSVKSSDSATAPNKKATNGRSKTN
jgi:hypothetical protein